MLEFWASSETNFIRRTSLQRLKLWGVAKLSARFLLALTKNISFMEWPLLLRFEHTRNIITLHGMAKEEVNRFP